MPKRSGQGAAPGGGGPAERQTPRTNDEWSAGTIEALTRLARRAFARDGFGATSIDRVAAEASLTKGAVYFHFGNKVGLFEAVLRDAQRDLLARIDARAGQRDDPVEALRAGCEAFLELAIDDDLRQIVLADGPAVLGWSKWRLLDAEYGLGSLKEGLEACREAGRLDVAGVDLDVIAHWLSGALNEAVFVVAEAPDRGRALDEAKRALSVFLSSLLSADALRRERRPNQSTPGTSGGGRPP